MAKTIKKSKLFDDVISPYRWEEGFYKTNKIPLWSCQTNKSKSLGKIYIAPNKSYVKAKVTPMPAQFWEFEVYNAETNKKHIVSSGSGVLEQFFPTAKLIADGMLSVVQSVVPIKRKTIPEKKRVEMAKNFIKYLVEFAEKYPDSRIAKAYRETKDKLDNNKKISKK